MDVSYDGALLSAEWPLPVGSLVELRMRMPDSRVWFNARGIVRRISRGRRDGDASPSMGVYLYEMNGMDRVMLSTIARAYPSPPAPRGFVRNYAREVRRIADAGPATRPHPKSWPLG